MFIKIVVEWAGISQLHT